jgi:hypothetical protein
VRGAGANTQVLLASRAGNVVAVLTTPNGVNFSATLITVADAPTGAFGLGVAFGAGATFWGKATSHALRQVAFDLGAGTGSTIRNHGSPGIPGAVAPIGISPELNLLAGIQVGASNNHVRLYDLTSGNTTPVLLAANAFATDNSNTDTGTGALDFGAARLYALGANNGLLAMEIECFVAPAPPLITSHPQNETVTAGGNALFSVEAIGDSPLAYQWWFNGAPYPGATNGTFAINAVQEIDSGEYHAVITNSSGAATSVVATLTVLIPPEILYPPQDQSVVVGQDATFTVIASGTAPLAYQWQWNGTNIAGAIGGSYTRTNAQLAHAGEYSVVISNVAGVMNSEGAELLVLPAQPAQFNFVERDGSGVRLVWTGEPGWEYRIEASSNLVDWFDLGPVTSTNGVFEFFDAATNAQRFFRTRQ